MNIAVTGSTGFVGKYLTKELKKRRIKFESLDRKKHNLLRPETLKDFVSNKDIIVHLAGAHRDKSLIEMIRTNILGTQGLLSAIKTYSPNSKIIFASSFMVYVDKDIFGATKKAAEEIIEDYCNNTSIKGIILRFSNIYGKGGKPFKNSVITTFVHLVKKRKAITVSGDGSQKRDFLYITNAIDAIIKAIQYTPSKFECFDICTGKLNSLKKIIKMLSIQKKEKIYVIHRVSSNDHIYDLKKNYLKAKEKLGWSPEIFLEDGLKFFF